MGAPPSAGRYLTMSEAGAMAGKPARWARNHLLMTPGAPNHLEVPDPGSIDGSRRRTLLVLESDWIAFLQSFAVAPIDRTRAVRPGTVTRQVSLPSGLMSPGQRKRLVDRVAGTAA